MSKFGFYILCIGVFLLASTGMGDTPERIRSSDTTWEAEVVPQSLAVTVYPANTEIAVPISSGQAGLGSVTDFSHEGNIYSWNLPERSLSVRVELGRDSLTFEFTQDASVSETQSLTWPIIEDTESIHGYILPFFEGSYVPKDDAIWQDFLREQGPINTTAGLSMPFWGLDLGDRTLTYILTNPFNNQILFSKTARSALGMQVSHAFTPNWERKTYGVRISLGEASPVAPAKQYRAWLQQNGEFVSFSEKIAQTREAEQLLGAVHAYLWGGKLLSRYDVTDWKAFATKLSRGSNERAAETVEGRIFSRLNAEAKKAIQDIVQSDHPSNYIQRFVSRAISRQLEKPNFYKPDAWAGISLASETEKLVSRKLSTLSFTELYRRNCFLLYAAFPNMLRHPDEWGDGLSVKLLERFAKNGLDRLWLGVDSWQDGFRHPAAVAKAKALGYLVGPYDSYHSIHHPDEENTWETAQFDILLYESGGIVNADGTKNRGFKKKGISFKPARCTALCRVSCQRYRHTNAIGLQYVVYRL